MATKEARKYGFEIEDSNLTIEYLSDMISQLFGYEVTQAYTCAAIIARNGSYVVKIFKASELAQARETLKIAKDRELKARLLPM
jgi:hypothetical protein